MLKKTVCVLLALCALVLFLCPPPAAAAQTGQIRAALHSDIAGCTQADTGRLVTLQTDNVILKGLGDCPVSVADFAGTPEPGALAAGRTYYIDYALAAAPGCTLPETLAQDAVLLECGEGVKVISVQLTAAPVRQADGQMRVERGVKISARVTVDGSFFRRVAGYVHDLILKIRAWSLY